jgi:starvation-inducible DNA-binding protein
MQNEKQMKSESKDHKSEAKNSSPRESAISGASATPLGKASSSKTVRGRVNIGLSAESLAEVVVLLNRALSNASLLTIKTKKFHWDIVGPQFIALHKLWDEQYTELVGYVDEIAERVRARGGFPIGTAAGFLEHASVMEHPGIVASATEAVSALLEDHELLARTLRTSIESCDDLGDAGSADFLTKMLEGHEQMAWMHRSFLEGEAIQANGSVASGIVPQMA